jgi:hypothetical protein
MPAPMRVAPVVALATLVAGLAGGPQPVVHAEPEDTDLVLLGAAMAVPTYFFNVVVHEGTHALVAKAFGAEIVRFQMLPGRHPTNGRFYFGYVQYRGGLSLGEQTFFLLAPKISDLAALTGYGLLVATDALPDSRYGQLALVVLATGFWIDFTKDVVAFWAPTDVAIALERNGRRSFAAQLPWRLVHASLSVAAGAVVLAGYRRLFGPPVSINNDEVISADQPLMVPLWSARF